MALLDGHLIAIEMLAIYRGGPTRNLTPTIDLGNYEAKFCGKSASIRPVLGA